jgi:hypothetical protein
MKRFGKIELLFCCCLCMILPMQAQTKSAAATTKPNNSIKAVMDLDPSLSKAEIIATGASFADEQGSSLIRFSGGSARSSVEFKFAPLDLSSALRRMVQPVTKATL